MILMEEKGIPVLGKETISRLLRVLVIEDSEDDAFFIVKALQENGQEIEHERVYTITALTEALNNRKWDIIISDYSLPNFTGLEAISIYKSLKLDIPFLIVSGAIGEAMAVEAMKSGAHDYIMKDNLTRLLPAVERELKQSRGRAARRRAVETIKRMNEMLLNANEKLKDMDAIKNQLLSNVSHELRTPLVAIRGYTELIRSGESGPLSPLQEKQLDISLRNIDKLISLINNLLDFSRMQFDRETWNINSFDLQELLMECIRFHGPAMAAKNINIHTEYPENKISMKSDRDKLYRVFNNLIDNAVKFTLKGGDIRITLEMQGDKAAINISDTGPGIPVDEQRKIFERFYQGDASSTRRYGGVGLGLSLCHEVVEYLGGEIMLVSSGSHGSVFRVVLPVIFSA